MNTDGADSRSGMKKEELWDYAPLAVFLVFKRGTLVKGEESVFHYTWCLRVLPQCVPSLVKDLPQCRL